MTKFIAIVLFIIGLVLAGLAYSCYSDYEWASSNVRFYRTNPDVVRKYDIPTGVSREQYIAKELMRADRNRNLAMLSGAGSFLLCIGGAALFVRSRRKDTFIASPEGGLNEDPILRLEAMNRWASLALEHPVEVQFTRIETIMVAFIMVFFIGMDLLGIVSYGFTSTTALILILSVSFSFMLYYIVNGALKKSVSLFDRSGVRRRDNRRFNWSEFKGVDYLMGITRSGEEYLWRIVLVFDSGEALIIPLRIKNLEDIYDIVETIPGTHQKCLGKKKIIV